jgi:heterodisulfide reductase subunit A2
VGSRDEKRGVDYCSKICCKYSYGLARLLRALHPELDITIFFMDWRPYDLKGDDLLAWSLRDDHLKLVRGRPAEIIPSEEGKPAVRFVDVQERSLEEEAFDLVILAVGIVPAPDLPLMADMLGVQLSERGFVHSSEERPTLTNRPGVFAAGCCRGPADIQESVMDGVTAAGEAMAFLGGLS